MTEGIDRKIIDLRHRLHQMAELSGREVRTKAFLMEYLEEETDLEIVDRGSWFYAMKKACGQGERGDRVGEDRIGEGPIAFRCDMDALPMEDIIELPYRSETHEVSHRCGHDGHCAAMAGLCMRVDSLRRDRDIYFIFQHGEETGIGGSECAKLIEEKNIEEIYAFHNWSGFEEGAVVIGQGTVQLASRGLTIGFTGKPTHASQPERGKNPAQALGKMIEKAASFSYSVEKDSFLTIVGANCGGRNFGIAPAEAEISITLRGKREEDILSMEEELLEGAEAVAAEHNLQVKWETADRFPETSNSHELAELVEKVARGLGYRVETLGEPFRSSEDFGYYSRKCKGCMIYIGNGKNYPHIHTENYDFNDNILLKAVELFYEICRERCKGVE